MAEREVISPAKSVNDLDRQTSLSAHTGDKGVSGEVANLSTATPVTDLVEKLLAAGASNCVVIQVARATEKMLAGDHQRGGGKRGTRLPDDWEISQECVDYALDRGMTRDRVAIEAEKFRNYWTSKSGADATKVDWFATWRNWVLIVMEKRNGQRASSFGASPRGADAILAGVGRLARRIAEGQSAAGRQRAISDCRDAAGQFDFDGR